MNNYYRVQLTESLRNTNCLLENLTNSCQKEKRKQSTTKTNSKSTSNKNNESARDKNSNLTNELANKIELTANNNKSSHRTLLKTNIDTTTYHSTLPEGPGSSLRSELWAIIIAATSIPENTFLTVYRDLKSATMVYKKHLVGHKTS
jgi:hypothetical protein